MEKTITVKIDPITNENYFDISDFSEYYEVDLIDSYEQERLKDGSIMFTFYDKDGNVLKPRK